VLAARPGSSYAGERRCHPTRQNSDIRAALTATAKDKGAAGKDIAYGYGILQAKAAVEHLGPSSYCTTSVTSKY